MMLTFVSSRITGRCSTAIPLHRPILVTRGETLAQWPAISTALVVMSLVLTSCEQSCTPTTTVAQDASVVVAPDAVRSGVFQATLTSAEKPLPDKSLTFSVKESLLGSPQLGNGTTNDQGAARLDLKGRPLRFAKTVNSDSYTASFAGDGTYCSSSDEAALDIVHVET